MDSDMLKEFLNNLVRQIAFIPTDVLEAYLHEYHSHIQHAHSVGPILDPTGYRNALHGHEFENAERQLKMTEHILEIRKLIDEHEAMRLKLIGEE